MSNENSIKINGEDINIIDTNININDNKNLKLINFEESLVDNKLKLNTNQTIGRSIDEMDVSLFADKDVDNNGIKDNFLTNGGICETSDDNNGNNDSEDMCDDNGCDEQLIDKLKFDITETDERVIVYVYIKHCLDLEIKFEENEIEVRFKTYDQQWNINHNGSQTSTYIWRRTLRGKIVPNECSYKTNEKKFEISLRKQSCRFRWDSLEDNKVVTTQLPQSPNNTSLNLTHSTSNYSNFNNSMSDNWQPIVSTIDNSKQSLTDSSKTTIDNDITDTVETIRQSSSVGKELALINNNVMNHTITKRVGYTGLDNLGNTCFMNAVIQCLSNTDPFRDYFISEHYKHDINETNPLGTGGHIARSFASLIKQLWIGKQSSVAPQHLKAIISEKVSQQFSGFAQHDAQELMAFLLDALHEDVNRIKEKPYIAVNSDECDNRNISDEQLADEAWKRYRMRNDSIVVDLFQGQFKSKLVCPVCKKVSITFDPFLYLSVPFPKPKITHEVYFFRRESDGMSMLKPVKYKIKLSHDSTVKSLLNCIFEATNVPANALRLIRASANGCTPVFQTNPNWPLKKAETNESLLCFELINPNDNVEDVQEFVVIQRLSQPTKSDNCAKCDKNSGWDNVDLKACKKCFRASYCDKTCQTEHWPQHKQDCVYRPEPIAMPFIISVPKSQLTYRKLCQIVYSYARHSVKISQHDRSGLNLNELTVNTPFVLRRISDKRIDKNEEIIKIESKSGDNDNNEKQSDQLLDINDYYIAMDWINSKSFGDYFVDVETFGIDCDTDMNTQLTDPKNDILLEDCMRLFTEPEILNPQEAWYCPQCKENREATKQIKLWRLPQILVIQLKRFSFRNIIWRDKIDRVVKFPINGLDISEFYCRTEYDPDFRPIYDLYAVVNHMGGMFGGHYTAFAKSSDNFENLDWRTFDDSRVDDMDEESVITRNAYMLFYKLRE